MKRLILLRGLPGCGKTTLANFLEEGLPGCIAHSADDYSMNPKTETYEFDISKLGAAHGECKRLVENAMINERPTIVVHNTNTTEKELKYYVDLATERGYQLISLIVENRHGTTNTHNVPDETLLKMEKRFSFKLI